MLRDGEVSLHVVGEGTGNLAAGLDVSTLSAERKNG